MMLARPFRKGVLISHTLIASATDDNQIIQHCWTPFGFRHVMTALKVKDRDSIGTPGSHTFSFKGVAHISQPQLLSYGSGNLGFWWHPYDRSALKL
jgi:hypothetical protein